MYLSNTLVYNGCLKCGNDSVANNRLKWAKEDQMEKVLLPYIENMKTYLYIFIKYDNIFIHSPL